MQLLETAYVSFHKGWFEQFTTFSRERVTGRLPAYWCSEEAASEVDVVRTGMKGIYSDTTVDQPLSPSDCHVFWMVLGGCYAVIMCFCPCRKCAMIAAHYGFSDVFDNLIISLCKFTTLSSEVSLSQSPVSTAGCGHNTPVCTQS